MNRNATLFCLVACMSAAEPGRGVAFGNIDAIDSAGIHGDTKPVGSNYSWDLVSSRMNGFVGPYLRVGAVF